MNLSDQINAAVTAHGRWKARLQVAIDTGKFDVAVPVVRSDHNCEFGKWLYALDAQTSRAPAYKTCKELHGKFHVAAADVLSLALAGKKQEALKALDRDSDFSKLSGALTIALMNWARSA